MTNIARSYQGEEHEQGDSGNCLGVDIEIFERTNHRCETFIPPQLRYHSLSFEGSFFRLSTGVCSSFLHHLLLHVP